ncbi:MAG: plasmid partitioning protein RepB [Roseibium sp.]|uniref:plasmid partitioning protein RepB n=1 Tax=Roseibium sp. TaxID=1936156 RepID=UPI0032972A56
MAKGRRKDVLGLSEIMANTPKQGEQTSTPADPPPSAVEPRRGSAFDHGAIGGMRSTLMESASRSVQEIDPEKIREFGPNDRLAIDESSILELAEAIKMHGQHVPVMLRQDPEDRFFYQVIYGRRRIAAARYLQIPVKALVRNLDDAQTIIARGQENALRLNPSYIEKVLFMRDLLKSGYEMTVIGEALGLDRTNLSRMKTVSARITEDLIRWIGAAPGVGRRRWADLAAVVEQSGIEDEALLAFLSDLNETDSDLRFEAALQAARNYQNPAASEQPKSSPASASRPVMLNGERVAETKRGSAALTLKLFGKSDDRFVDWVERNAEKVLAKAREDWEKDINNNG